LPDTVIIGYHSKMKSKSSDSIKRIALLPSAALVLSWTPIFIRLAAEGDAPPLIIVFNRLVIASVILAVYVLCFKRRSFADFNRRAFIPAVCAGVFFGLHAFTYVLAVKYTTVANSMLFLATVPIFAAVSGHLFFKERPHSLSYLAILITIAGSALIVWGDIQWDPQYLKGDLFGIASAVLGAWYFLMRRLVPPKERAEFFPYILTMYVTSTVVLFFIVLFSGNAGRITGYAPSTWLWFFMLGFFSTVIGHSLYNKSLDFFKAHVAGSWILTEPIISAALAWVILAEAFNWRVLWGVAPIFAGVFWILWLERER